MSPRKHCFMYLWVSSWNKDQGAPLLKNNCVLVNCPLSCMARMKCPLSMSMYCSELTVTVIIVITFYLPSFLGQETVKELFLFGIKLPSAQCPPFYYGRWRLYTVLYYCWRSSSDAVNTICIVFGLTRPEIEPESTISAETLYPVVHWSVKLDHWLFFRHRTKKK